MKHFFRIFAMCFLFFALCACGKDRVENIPKNEIPITVIESAIKAAIKAEHITSGSESTGFEEEMLPNYRSIYLSEARELGIDKKYDLSVFDDGVAIIHKSADNADLIAIGKVKDEKIAEAEKLASLLRDFQLSMSHSYPQSQINKIKGNIIKTVGNYIIYITYSDTKLIEDAILNVIQ